jgi:hypothetical protein
LDGRSAAFDVNGAALVEVGSKEGVFIAEFDLKRNSQMPPHLKGQLSGVGLNHMGRSAI